MNTFEDHGGTSPQPINECRRESPEPPLAHSKGGPDANPLKNRISVRFATPLAVEIEIKYKHLMMQKSWLDQLLSPLAAWVNKAINLSCRTYKNDGQLFNFMKTKNIILTLAAATVMVAALAGCNQNPGTTPADMTNTPSGQNMPVAMTNSVVTNAAVGTNTQASNP
jgi:hypothetical protein